MKSNGLTLDRQADACKYSLAVTKKKRQNSSVPRHTRLNRSQRLQAGSHWVTTYKGKNIVRSFQSHFGVDRICALLELKTLGRPIDEATIQSAKMSAKKRDQVASAKNLEAYLDSDSHHYYIAGYTENGFAYGKTWEEAENDALEDNP